MASTVEEWLAQGNEIKRDREDVVVELDGFRWVSDRETSADFRCELSGVYGHQRSALTSSIRPYVCAEHGCKEHGTAQSHGLFWCAEHADRTGKRKLR